MDKNKKNLKNTDEKKNNLAEDVNDAGLSAKKLDEEADEETSVIQEQIKPWHKRKFKKTLSVIGFSLLAGIIFGVAARFVFKYSDSIISKIFGLNQPYDSTYGRPSVTINPSGDPGTSKEGDSEVKIKPSDGDTTEGKKQDNVKPSVIESDGTALTEYRKAVDEMRLKAEQVRKGIVTIESVTSVVNWLGESIEQSENTLGIVVAENPEIFYILTYYDRVKGSDRIELSFRSRNIYTASLLNYDESYNLAVLVLPKQAIRPEDMENISLLEIGDSDEISAGLPVIAIGTRDGKNEIVEYGFVTGDSFSECITDAVVGLFTTDVQHSDNGEGIVADLDGKVIGIITRRLGTGIMPDTNKCMRVNDLVKMAEKLCNGENRVYFGIKAEDIPSWALVENHLENGIYVNNVEPSSPASDAGLRKGDFIISVDGVKINEVEEFSDILMKATENSSLEIEIYRTSKAQEPEFTVTVKPVKRNK